MKVNQIVDGFYEYNEPYFDVDLLDADDMYAVQEIATHNVIPLFLGKLINKPDEEVYSSRYGFHLPDKKFCEMLIYYFSVEDAFTIGDCSVYNKYGKEFTDDEHRHFHE
jgi:hypothetical protein